MLSRSIKTPAYREPWFWVVFSPLVVVAVVCTGLVTLAFTGADDRVYDDYYKQGRMINNQFQNEHNALSLAVRGVLGIARDGQSISVTLAGKANPPELLLNLSHPADAALDESILLTSHGGGHYLGFARRPLTGRWYAIISAEASDKDLPWRVSTEWNLSTDHSISFNAHQ